jgi:uncharacterized protein (TIGR02996 family)
LTDLEQAFLQAIRSQPDDDAPRLVYADWLDEQGQSERAELVRLQCTLAGLPETLDQLDRRLALQERARQLLAAHEHRWAPATQLDLTWRRGFIDEVTLTSDDDPADLDTLASQHVITSLVCDGSMGHLGRFFGPDRPHLPWLAHLRRLSVTLDPDWTFEADDWYRPLLDRLADSQLVELALDSLHEPDLDLLADLRARPFFPRLRTLRYGVGVPRGRKLARWLRSLGDCQLSELYVGPGPDEADEFFAALTAPPLASRWQGLALSLGRESAADLSQLAACANLQTLLLDLRDYWYRRPHTSFPELPQLRRLDVTVSGEAVDADLAALAASPVVPQLSECRLDIQRYTGHTASSPDWRLLGATRSRHPSGAGSGPAASAASRDWWPLAQLLARLPTPCADLRVSINEFLVLIASAKGQPNALHNIRRLTLLGQSAVEMQQLVTLFVPNSLACLQGLSYLYHRSPPDASLTTLLTASDWPFLTALELMGTRLGDGKLACLLDQDRFPRLTFLALHRCGLTDADLQGLAAWPGLAQMQELQLDGNAYTEAGLIGLAQSAYLQPGTRIVCDSSTDAALDALRQRVGAHEVFVVT